VAQRRYAAGDIAILDVNLATADASRASARLRIARAAQREAWGDLRQLLGLDFDAGVAATTGLIAATADVAAIDVQGDLRRVPAYALADLLFSSAVVALSAR
jgi:outer membrane protein TolC